MPDLWPKALRERLWEYGYRPVAIPHGKKFPTTPDWHNLALQNPPAIVVSGPDPMRPYTGILTAGLRVIDIDLDDPHAVDQIGTWCLRDLGDAPIRTRANSPRMLLVYAAATGEPSKTKCWNHDTKQGVEVLGAGQQFMAYGDHPSGWPLRWYEDLGPHRWRRAQLSIVTEDQIDRLLTYARQFVGTAAITDQRVDLIAAAEPHEAMSIQEIGILLANIPNSSTDWNRWLAIGMACYAADNSSECRQLFQAWSAQVDAHAAEKNCTKLWNGLHKTPPNRVTAATLIHHATQANQDFNLRQQMELEQGMVIMAKKEHTQNARELSEFTSNI